MANGQKLSDNQSERPKEKNDRLDKSSDANEARHATPEDIAQVESSRTNRSFGSMNDLAERDGLKPGDHASFQLLEAIPGTDEKRVVAERPKPGKEKTANNDLLDNGKKQEVPLKTETVSTVEVRDSAGQASEAAGLRTERLNAEILTSGQITALANDGHPVAGAVKQMLEAPAAQDRNVREGIKRDASDLLKQDAGANESPRNVTFHTRQVAKANRSLRPATALEGDIVALTSALVRDDAGTHRAIVQRFVKSGDTLSGIARENMDNVASEKDVSEYVKIIAKDNRISNPNELQAGTMLALRPFEHADSTESTDTHTASEPEEFDQQPPGRSEKIGDKYTLKIDVIENVIIGDTAESESDQQNLRNATRAILDTAKERFGKDGIEQLEIASDDVGSSMTALLLGPDQFKSMGPVEARNFGNRLMVFGLAPLFGMAQEAHKELVENTSETIKEGPVNFLAGTGLGIMLERAHPLLLAGLTIGFTGQFVRDQFCSPENKQRNAEILDISSKLGNVGSDDLAQYCRRSKELLGPDLFKGAFGMATGGIGIPKGLIIAAETKAETAAISSKIKPGDVLENLSQLPSEACDALAWLFGHDGGPKLAWAHSVHGEMPAQKYALDSTDNLAMADGRYFEWIKYLGKPALNPDLKLSEAVEMAIEKMVKPLKENLKKLSEKFPDSEKLANHLKDRQEHFDSLTRILSQLSEPRDLLRLYENGHKFHFADLEDIGKHLLGQSAEVPQAPHVKRGVARFYDFPRKRRKEGNNNYS